MSPELRAAFDFFRAVLGESWRGWMEGAPLAQCFGLCLQSRSPEWVRLYRLTLALEDVELRLRDALVKRDLGSSEWAQFMAAVMTLEFCGRLRPAGVAVALIETGGAKNPADVEIDISGRQITVEFKAMHEPDGSEEWHALFELLAEGLALRGMQASGFDLELQDAALDHPDAVIDGAIAALNERASDFRDLGRGAGRVRFTGSDMAGWHYPKVRTPDLPRIANKLKSGWWKKFVDTTGPTLLVVRTGVVLSATAEGMVLRAQTSSEALREAMAVVPALGGTLLYDEPFLPPMPPVHVSGEEFRLTLDDVDGCARTVLFVPNPVADVALDEKEIATLVGPTMRW
jgi:hypothetical protein